MARTVQKGLNRAVIFGQHHRLQVLLVFGIKIGEVLEAGALEFKNRLIVVANDKHVGGVPIVDQLQEDLVLGTIGVLVLIYQQVKVLLLVTAQEVFVGLKGAQYPQNHVLVIVTPGLLLGCFIARVKFGSGPQALHALLLFLDFGLFEVAFALCALVALVAKFRTLGQAVEPIVNLLDDVCGSPVFHFAALEKIMEVGFVKVYVTLATFERMLYVQLIQ